MLIQSPRRSIAPPPTIAPPLTFVRCPNCGSAIKVSATGLVHCKTCAIALPDHPVPKVLAERRCA